MDSITLNTLDKNLHVFQKMYDAIRIVDPITKQILDFRCNERIQCEQSCYDYWKNGRVCSNCISVRAYRERKSFFKLEKHPDSIMMVTSVPLDFTEKPAVLELLKDVTDSLMISSTDHQGDRLICNMIYQLNDLIVHDSLTNLYNRRYVDDQLPVDIVRATVGKKPLTLIFMDVNEFKYVNDTYGHTVGDAVLREISHAIISAIQYDKAWAARYGGDEFLMCLNNTNEEQALETIRNLEELIESIAIPIRDKSLHISVSMGYHTIIDTPLSAEELIRLADEMMYKNKKQNRYNLTKSIQQVEATNQ